MRPRSRRLGEHPARLSKRDPFLQTRWSHRRRRLDWLPPPPLQKWRRVKLGWRRRWELLEAPRSHSTSEQARCLIPLLSPLHLRDGSRWLGSGAPRHSQHLRVTRTRHASLPPAPRPRQPVGLPCWSTDQKSPRRPAGPRMDALGPHVAGNARAQTRLLGRIRCGVRCGELSSRAFAGTLVIARGRSVSIGRSGHGRGHAGPSTTYSSHGRVARGPIADQRRQDARRETPREEAEPEAV